MKLAVGFRAAVLWAIAYKWGARRDEVRLTGTEEVG